MLANGSKSYAHKLNHDKEVVKQKGIALDYINSKLSTFDSFTTLAMKEEAIESHPRYGFESTHERKRIHGTRKQNIKCTLDENRINIKYAYATLPFGYEDASVYTRME